MDLFESLFGMANPWWEFILRAGSVYLVVLLMVRLTGKRTVGQFTPFFIQLFSTQVHLILELAHLTF